MPKAEEICEVVANGQKYNIWQSVEVTTTTDDVIDHALLTVAEPSTGAKKLSDLKLQPGDRASVTLAGQTVIDGIVYLRQGALDPNNHAVQIGISSLAQGVIASTVRNAPGQYLNQTLLQIGSAVFGEIGVKFSIAGSPPGADKIFPRISEHVGETRFDFISALCRMRNLHLVDDGQNGIVAFRGPQGRAVQVLQEGFNILRANILLKNNEHADNLQALGQQPNQDSGDVNRSSRAYATVDPPIGRNINLPCEIIADNADCQMRVNHEADWVKYMQVDGDVTVQGWLNKNGLWWNDRRKIVVVNSPSLLPNNSFGFMIKGVTHRQNNSEGTTTSILLCRADGLGAGGEPLTGL